MHIATNIIAWHVQNEKEASQIGKRFAEYSIPFSISKEKTMLPKHSAVMVSRLHIKKASQVLLRFFGRRSGVDIM